MKLINVYSKDKHIVVDFSEVELEQLVEYHNEVATTRTVVSLEVEKIMVNLQNYLRRGIYGKEEKQTAKESQKKKV